MVVAPLRVTLFIFSISQIVCVSTSDENINKYENRYCLEVLSLPSISPSSAPPPPNLPTHYNLPDVPNIPILLPSHEKFK